MTYRFISLLFFPLMIFAAVLMPGWPAAHASEVSDGNTPVLYDPFDRENPLVKLPGLQLTYTKGRDRSDAIYFDGSTYLREPALTFVPYEKNWTEGAIAFWINPAKYPQPPHTWAILLFNWNDYLKPQAGYVGTISLTHEGKILDSGSWEWGGGTPVSVLSKSVIPPNAWTHVADASHRATRTCRTSPCVPRSDSASEPRSCPRTPATSS